jgi:hypothetical protein
MSKKQKRDLRAESDSLTKKYSHLPWVQRYLQGNELTIPDIFNPSSGKKSSHGLEYRTDDKGGGMIYPRIVQQGDSLVDLGEGAFDYARKNKTLMYADSILADFYSKNGLIQHSMQKKQKGGKIKGFIDKGANLFGQGMTNLGRLPNTALALAAMQGPDFAKHWGNNQLDFIWNQTKDKGYVNQSDSINPDALQYNKFFSPLQDQLATLQGYAEESGNKKVATGAHLGQRDIGNLKDTPTMKDLFRKDIPDSDKLLGESTQNFLKSLSKDQLKALANPDFKIRDLKLKARQIGPAFDAYVYSKKNNMLPKKILGGYTGQAAADLLQNSGVTDAIKRGVDFTGGAGGLNLGGGAPWSAIASIGAGAIKTGYSNLKMLQAGKASGMSMGEVATIQPEEEEPKINPLGAMNAFSPTFLMGGDISQANVEVEGGEIVGGQKIPDELPSHKEGGVDINAKPGTEVLSDDPTLLIDGMTYANKWDMLTKEIMRIEKQLS